MAWLAWCEGQAIPAACPHTTGRQRGATRSSGGGPKGPPSAPPAIPPIIITPFSYHTPEPAIDPRYKPPKPPLVQRRPCVVC